jgi:hypothetical protein
MDNKLTPTWMKTMQNGGLAEARARAFLMNRFWILERSVDINGADFIIQRRLSQSNLLDDKAPRLGVVQVKFFESSNTTQYIHKEYIVDGDNMPRQEFFILCHTGDEDAGETYFFTAADIQKDFEAKLYNGVLKYALSGNKVLNSSKYRVLNNKIVLDRMEQHLKVADFTKNRNFISWSLPIAQVSPDHIIPDFAEPIYNWWGSIPQGFHDLKKAIAHSLINISEIYDKLKAIGEEADPIKAISILEEVESDCRGGRGWSISLSDELDNHDFREACKQHRDKIDELKAEGLLDQFLSLKIYFKTQIASYLSTQLPVATNITHSFTFSSTPEFNVNIHQHDLTDANDFAKGKENIKSFTRSPNLGVIMVKAGEFLAYWRPGYILKQDNYTDIYDYFNTSNLRIYDLCMEAIYEDKYYECEYFNLTI